MYLISVGIVFVSYWGNMTTMKAVIARSDAMGGSSILDEILSFDFSRILSSEDGGATLLLLHNYIGKRKTKFYKSII
jgi:E3 ubiquitin-protein ligase RNF139